MNKSTLKTSTLIINPLTPIKTDPVKGNVALLTFGNVTIQLEQQIMFSLFSMLPDKKEFNRTVELLAAGFKEISREMQLEQTSKMPKEHRDSENKILLGMDNLLNPESFITGDHILLSEKKTDMNDQRRFFFDAPLGQTFKESEKTESEPVELYCPRYDFSANKRNEHVDNRVYLSPTKEASETFANNHIKPDAELEKLVTEVEKKFINNLDKGAPKITYLEKQELGLIEFFVDDLYVTTWPYTGDAEIRVFEFCKIYWMGYNRNGVLA